MRQHTFFSLDVKENGGPSSWAHGRTGLPQILTLSTELKGAKDTGAGKNPALAPSCLTGLQSLGH